MFRGRIKLGNDIIEIQGEFIYEKSAMNGGMCMSTMEANLALISTIPEERQEEIRTYLLMNFCTDNPFKPLSAEEIASELAQARECYEKGEGENFDDAVDEISAKYGL